MVINHEIYLYFDVITLSKGAIRNYFNFYNIVKKN